MGLTEGPLEAGRHSAPCFHHLLIKVSSDFLTVREETCHANPRQWILPVEEHWLGH